MFPGDTAGCAGHVKTQNGQKIKFVIPKNALRTFDCVSDSETHFSTSKYLKNVVCRQCLLDSLLMIAKGELEIENENNEKVHSVLNQKHQL